MLGRLSNLVLPTWVKFVPYIVIAFLAAWLYIASDQRDDARAQRDNEITWRQSTARTLRCPKDGQVAVTQCLNAALATSDNRRETLERISNEAQANAARAARADAELAREQSENQRRLAAAQRRISDLEGRRSTGNPTQDAAQIEQDSRAAWESWR